MQPDVCRPDIVGTAASQDLHLSIVKSSLSVVPVHAKRCCSSMSKAMLQPVSTMAGKIQLDGGKVFTDGGVRLIPTKIFGGLASILFITGFISDITSIF